MNLLRCSHEFTSELLNKRAAQSLLSLSLLLTLLPATAFLSCRDRLTTSGLTFLKCTILLTVWHGHHFGGDIGLWLAWPLPLSFIITALFLFQLWGGCVYSNHKTGNSYRSVDIIILTFDTRFEGLGLKHSGSFTPPMHRHNTPDQ